MARHNAIVRRTMDKGMPAGARSSGGRGRSLGAGFAEIGKAARAADLKASRERMRLSEKEARHRVKVETAAERKIEQERRASRRRQLATRRERRIGALRQRQAAALAASGARDRFARSTLGVGSRSVGGSLRAIGGMGAGALALGGGFAVSGAIGHAKELNKVITGLANQAFREDGSAGSREEIAGKIRKRVTAVGAGGEGAANVTEGLRTYVAKTGDLDTGLGLSQFATDLATASDASITDVFDTAGSIMLELNKRGIKGNDALELLKESLSVIGGQAKEGSVEFADLATYMAKVTSSMSAIGGKGEFMETFKTAGALTQMAISGGAPDAAEAATAITRMSSDMIANADRFKKLGVNVFDRDSEGRAIALRNPLQILQDVFAKTGGDIEKTQALFGERGARAATPVMDLARNLGEGDAMLGIAKMLEEVARFKDASMSEKEIVGSAAFRREQSDLRFDAAIEKFNIAVGEELLPVITKLVPEFVKLIPSLTAAAKVFGHFVDDLVRNPIGTIGKVIAAKLVLDLASAGIGAAARKALTNALSKIPVAPTTPGGAHAPAGGFLSRPTAHAKVAAAGMGAAIGLTVGTAIITAGVANFETGEQELKESGSALNQLRELAKGEMTPEKAEAAKRIFSEQQSRVAEISKPGMVESVFGEKFAEFIGTRDKVQQDSQQKMLDEMRQIRNSIMDATSAQKEAAATIKASGGGTGMPNRGSSPSPVKG